MAGRVPEGADRAALAAEMEATFVDNLWHAASVLAQVLARTLQARPQGRLVQAGEGGWWGSP